MTGRTQLSADDLAVRRYIYERFVLDGHPPSATETARALALAEEGARAAYRNLHDAHAIVLRNGDATRVRVAHPLSAYPTTFRVRTASGSWWGNCIWDSLGVLAMLGQDGTIETRSGAAGSAIRLEVRGGNLAPKEGFVHIPLPAREWWHDIDFTCSHILLFAEEDEIAPWLARVGIPRGEVVTLETMWRLAQRWFGGRLDADWRPRSPAESQAILREVGLAGEFWRLHP